MSIIIDLVIVAIIALCILIGYHKGLTGSLLKNSIICISVNNCIYII